MKAKSRLDPLSVDEKILNPDESYCSTIPVTGKWFHLQIREI
ncbi:MAG: hypothetical protein ACLFVT_08070 [Syntrophobacteria bacterium]